MATNSIPVEHSISPRREPLAGAYVWLLLFMVIYCARPEDWIPGLVVVPLAKITGIFALIALLFAMGGTRQRLPREIIYLILLMVQLWLTVPFSPVWRGGAFQNSLDFSKVVPIVIVMALAVNSLKRLRRLVFVQCASVAVIAAVAVWRGRVLAGRLEGVLNGNYANPNDLAFAIVLSLPLCLVLAFLARNKFSKAVWAAAMAVMAYAVFLTASRGGFACFIVATAICLWDFSIRGRRRYLIPVVALAGIAFWAYAGGGVSGRFNSALHSNSNEVEDSAYGSAQARWGLFTQSLKVTARYPLFGVGTGNFEIVSGSWHATHNAFTQMSSEGGVPALLLFILILWCGFQNINATKRMAPGREPDLWARGFRASLGAFIVGSFFASEAYQFFTYFLIGYTTVLARMAAREREAGMLAVQESSSSQKAVRHRVERNILWIADL